MMSAMIGAGKIDLFCTLNQGSGTLEELAKKTNCDNRALHNLLRVLGTLGYVEENNGRYSLTKYTRKALPVELYQDFTYFVGPSICLSIEHVEHALREAPEEGVIGWDRVKEGELARTYQVTMRWLASSTVKEVVKKIKLPNGSKKMLDIGGSHGLYCVEMCRKYPQLQATVMDWPVGIENAEQTLQQETNVADRIDTLEADFFEEEFSEDYDFAFFGNIIHGNAPEQNQELFNRLGQSLTEKGTVGILDQFDNISGSRFNRSVASLIGWNLFLFSNGRAYEVDEVLGWLRDAGFPKSQVKPLKKSPGFTLLVASK